MCTTGQRVSLTITGLGPSFISISTPGGSKIPTFPNQELLEIFSEPNLCARNDGNGLEGGWGLEGAGGLGRELEPGGVGRTLFVCSFARSFGCSLVRSFVCLFARLLRRTEIPPSVQ